MKRKAVFLILSCLMIISLVLASCGTKSTSTTAQTTTLTSTSTSKPTSTPTSTSTSKPTSTPTSTSTTTGKWWDTLAKPQYSGTMVLRLSKDPVLFDPGLASINQSILSGWMERLFADDWTTDPAAYDYKGVTFRPSSYEVGSLAKSWEFTDPLTLTIHLRQGIHWQNIAPANGREFVADDVVAHINRSYFATTTYAHATTSTMQALLASASTADKYTVVTKWKKPNPEYIFEGLMLCGTSEWGIENPEAVKLWGDLSDWHHAIGTGPFILNDYVSGSSATLVKNPDYWGYDERYPQNKLPYLDGIKLLIIPDAPTALAGIRTGKIDDCGGMSVVQASDMQKSNPEILQIQIPAPLALSIDPRNDTKPFSDIRVRQAMQMAMNLPEIAKNYYLGACDPNPALMTSEYMKGYAFPYAQWPQSLKDQYTYNPTQAKQILATAGYPNGFSTNIVIDSGYDMNLIQIIQSYFAAIGVTMTITTMDPASWTNFVLTQRKYTQLASSSTGGKLGRVVEPLVAIPAFNTGDPANYMMISDPAYDAIVTKAIASSTVSEAMQLVQAANQESAEQHFVVSILQPNTFDFVQPWLKGYIGQDDALSGRFGPSFLGFYGARFWIDQNMKKSMGH